MTAYTSTQSGDFNNAATWGGGGYPSTSSDSFTVASGHTVTYNVSTAIATGFTSATINTGGTFNWASGTRSLRVAGNFNIYGNYSQGVGHTLYMNGSNGTRLNLYNSSSAHSKSFIGSPPLAETTTSSATTGLSGTIPVTSSTGFAAGDWISVYIRTHTTSAGRQDEGYLIHEISGNNIYVREFVGPNSDITSVSGSSVIHVSDADKFRVGQAVIFGTGSNRNISTINSIDTTRNTITLSSSITGSVIGETVYTTGPLKNHDSGSIVRRLAAKVTSNIAVNDTSFTVNDASDFEVGDTIVVECNFSDSYTNDEKPVARTISSISGNTITTSTSFAVQTIASTGAFVVKLIRDCRVENESGSSWYVHELNNSSYYGSLVLQDVEFKQMARTDSNSGSRIYFRGRWKGGSGNFCNIDGMSIWYTSTPGYQEIRFYRYLYDWTVRNCVFHNITYVLSEQGYNNDSIAFLNNHFSRCESYGLLIYYNDGDYHETAYNRTCGIDDDALRLQYFYTFGLGIHHNSAVNNKRRAYTFQANYSIFFYQNESLNSFESPILAYHADSRSGTLIQYNKLNTPFAAFDYTSSSVIGDLRESTGDIVISTEHNFHLDKDALYFWGGHAEWDPDEQAYLNTFDNDGGTFSGVMHTIYVPANVTMRVRAVAKVVSGFSGTAPQLRINSLPSRQNTSDQFINNNNWDESEVTTTMSATGSWENVDATLTSTTFPRYVGVGMYITSTNASEGFYIKKMDVNLDGLPKGHNKENRHRIYDPCRINFRNTFTQAKKRIGGRIG